VACFPRYNCDMSRTISAIFDAGVFRPLEPVEMAEGTRVELQLSLSAPDANECEAPTVNTWLDFVNRMELLPDNSPKDGLSNRDHDRVIYGG
jgi:predicted DNA-binding antitoxin AbrB/MazE fold protein